MVAQGLWLPPGHLEGFEFQQTLWGKAPLNPTSVTRLPTLAPAIFTEDLLSSSLPGQEGNPATLTMIPFHFTDAAVSTCITITPTQHIVGLQ